MNKTDFVAAIAASLDVSKADAAKAVDAVLAQITSALASGDEVKFPGFGTFSVADRAAKDGRNPRTGETVAIPATRLTKFKVGADLKRVVAG